MSIAIGIPTYNRGHVLVSTIEQVIEQDPPADEIIVVDQSDWYPDGVRERLEALAREGRLRYIFQSPPNLPAARNRILRESLADIVVFIDDDVELDDGFVKHHASNYSDPAVWGVAGRVRQRLGWPKRWRPRRWRKELDYRFFDYEGTERREVGTFPGVNHSVRRERALALGGYDEGYRGVALREETDLALRILHAGGRILFEPAASLLHLQAPTGGCRVTQWSAVSAAECNLRFVLKHWQRLGWVVPLELWHTLRLGVLSKANMRRLVTLIADCPGLIFRSVRFRRN